MWLKLKRNDKIGLFFFVAFVLSTTLTWLFEERFNQQQWQSERTTRYKLAEDIIKSKMLIAKTKEEVILLLGPASPSSLTGSDHLVYTLGKPPSFFEAKEEKLVIIFKENRVIEVVHFEE
ncbi:hypothetical protein FG167_03800 [Lacinutrix sp. WUR7]|uniref:hypothetical protein n=1 Tax=Lacinutrix sp. WUR7 TaxID=2653681 RepID=UPI00193D5BD1|nr:hypothetical protein [Lacinutrix sp. WUR7]QRM88380.1 hypothetical protein FG167_03800 [Lacinutrix sp. WUR7]